MKGLSLFPIFLFFFTSCQEKAPPLQTVSIVRVEEGEKSTLSTFPGITRAVGRATLSFRVEGPIIERPAKVGDKVKVGTLLARIDPRDFERSLKRTKGELEKVEAELRFAQGEYKRALNIYNRDAGAISQTLLDRKKEDVSSLEGTLHALAAKVEADEDQLSYTYLYSPYDATVVATYAENHEYVEAKQPILRLLNHQEIELIIDVPEELICYIPYITRGTVQLEALGSESFNAEIKEIGEEAIGSSRTYPVTLSIEPKEDTIILSGMRGKAFFEVDHEDAPDRESFILPKFAVFKSNGHDCVWVVDQHTKRIYSQPVTLGPFSQGGVRVIRGVTKGMWIVTSPVEELEENEKVTVFVGTPSHA